MKKIEEIIKTYEELKIYRDTGKLNSTITDRIDGVETKKEIIFETEFDRQGYFKFKYSKLNKEKKIELNGLIIKENNHEETKSVIDSIGKETINQEMELKLAIASHTGISQKVSYIVPNLIFGKELASSLIYEGEENENFECKVNGEECLGIRVKREMETKTPTKEELQKVMETLENQPALLENIKKLEDNLDKIISQKFNVESTYYFRLKDNLLIKVEESNNSEKLNTKSVINYQPALNTNTKIKN